MYLHATGTIPDPDKLAPLLARGDAGPGRTPCRGRPEEPLAAQQPARGIPHRRGRRRGRGPQAGGTPALRQPRLLIFEFEPVEKLIWGAGAPHSAYAHGFWAAAV